MQNPPKACLEPAGPHAPKGWRGAAKLSAGFGEQRGWRNPSCVVTPQNLRVWGRMRRCAARRGLQGRCPLLRPPLPQRKQLHPTAGSAVPAAGDGPALRGGGGPDRWGEGGGRGRRRMRGRPSPCTGQRGGRGAGAGSPALRAGAGGRHRRGGRACRQPRLARPGPARPPPGDPAPQPPIRSPLLSPRCRRGARCAAPPAAMTLCAP